MTTHFITAEIDLQESSLTLSQDIETRLHQEGDPVRWAITEVEGQTAHVEAVVTVDSEA